MSKKKGINYEEEIWKLSKEKKTLAIVTGSKRFIKFLQEYSYTKKKEEYPKTVFGIRIFFKEGVKGVLVLKIDEDKQFVETLK